MLVDKRESCLHKDIEPKMALCKGHDILEPKIGDLNLGRFRRISVKTQHYTSNLNLIFFFIFKNKFNSRVSILETMQRVYCLNRNNILFDMENSLLAAY